MFHIPDKIKNDVSDYEQSLEKLLTGGIKDSFFRGIRVPWGFYSQRGGKIFMSRLRIPAGELTPVQLKAIGEAGLRFASGKLHITTRQDIQIHDLPIENTIKVIRYLMDYDLSPRGGGGNTVRNVTACFMSGVCPYGKMNVIPLAQKLSEYLLSLDYAYTLPRKFKVAFSACPKDCAGVALNDVGFIATSESELDVFCGGGMGAKSSVGRILGKGIKPQEILRVTEAVMDLFSRYGDRKDRHHNRLRFLIQSLGWGKFESIYRRIYEEKTKTLPLLGGDGMTDSGGKNEFDDLGDVMLSAEEIFADTLKSETKDYSEFIRHNVIPQKKNNGQVYFTVVIRIPQGEISSDDAIRLAEEISAAGDMTFRTTQRQNLSVVNVGGDILNKIFEICRRIFGDEFLYPDTIYDVVSCKAALTCNLGICNAMALAPEITRKIRRAGISPVDFRGFSININGCPNACGRHPAASLSFSGMAKKIGGHTIPFYRVFLGGKMEGENTRMADEVGSVPARVVPDVVVEFLKNFKTDADIARGKELLKKVVEKFSSIPSYEENRSYYIDYGRSENFSLDGLSQGECGAGVIDMMESDIESSSQSLQRARNLKELSEVKNAIYYASRALLVTRGIDAKNENEAASAFVEKFVGEGIASGDFVNLAQVVAELSGGEQDFKEDYYDYAARLIDEVKLIYKSMDGNFNFPRRYEDSVAAPNLTVAGISGGEEQSPPVKEEKQIYDLRGTPCPINYVKTKLRLEGMPPDSLLEVWLDDGEPIKNVPVSLKNDGQEVVKIEESENFFKVLVRKKV